MLGLLAMFVNNVGFAVTFGDPSIRIINWLRVIETALSIPVMYLTYQFFRPLYDQWRKIKTMSDTGLVTHYASIARDAYRYWMAREMTKQNQAFNALSTIFYEMKKRDPTLKGLYSLLKEPDDWIKITVARQLLGRPDGLALQTLETISQQNSEWSGYARNMASEWKSGKLKPWT
jgi:hypothetical protein